VGPDENFRKLFHAKVLADASMGHRINQILLKAGRTDRILVLVGVNHVAYGNGVPERVFMSNPWVSGKTGSIYCREADDLFNLDDLEYTDPKLRLEQVFGNEISVADYLFVCQANQPTVRPNIDSLDEIPKEASRVEIVEDQSKQ
jgi:hypothetical protein